MLSRVGCRGSRRRLNRRGAGPGLVGPVAGDRPAEAGEFAGDGDGDDRASLAALGVEALPDAVEALLSLPGDRLLSAAEAHEMGLDRDDFCQGILSYDLEVWLDQRFGRRHPNRWSSHSAK